MSRYAGWIVAAAIALIWPIKVLASFMLPAPQAAGIESMRLFSCEQAGFSKTACSGGSTTAADLNRWVKFSNDQGKEGYHFYQVQLFNYNGLGQASFWVYEKP